jgi:uncharacterized protein YodC (DUF2158 family)
MTGGRRLCRHGTIGGPAMTVESIGGLICCAWFARGNAKHGFFDLDMLELTGAIARTPQLGPVRGTFTRDVYRTSSQHNRSFGPASGHSPPAGARMRFVS